MRHVQLRIHGPPANVELDDCVVAVRLDDDEIRVERRDAVHENRRRKPRLVHRRRRKARSIARMKEIVPSLALRH